MKRSLKEIKELLPDDEVRQAFMNRDDIKRLSRSEREAGWQKALVNINKFQKWMAGVDSFVVP